MTEHRLLGGHAEADDDVRGRTAALRQLGLGDSAQILKLLARDPVSNVFVASRLHFGALDPRRLSGELWGWVQDGELVSVCFAGANLVPAEATPRAIVAFADRARRQGRRCSSIVGPSEAVLALWELLEESWGKARDVRRHQPLMAISGPPLVEADRAVRQVRTSEIDTLLPAAVAMFTEEVGVSPVAGDGGTLYRARIAEIVETGRAFARIEDGQVLFKAEIGAVSANAVQVQGVWVAPELRGRGLAAPGMAAVVEQAQEIFAPVVSLYVNDFNTPARRAYLRTGFEDVGEFATVLF